MGCCVSTNRNYSRKDQNFQLGSDQLLKPNKFSVQESRAPPPSAEEEKVKEVLSETPKFKNPFLENHVHDETNNKKKNDIHIDQKPSFLDEKIIKNQMIFQEEVISEQEVSEVCSLSMSETVSTTTCKRDDDYDDDDGDEEEMKQSERVKRSPVSSILPRNRAVSSDFASRKDWALGKSPTRRAGQSPDRRNNVVGRRGGGAVRLVQSKESGYHHAGKRGLRSDPDRKDPGEGSGRRSKSPATNRSVMGRSPSVKRTNGSPVRFRTDPHESGGSRVESGMEGGKWPSNLSNVGGTTPANESLENPLVSLECFIFL